MKKNNYIFRAITLTILMLTLIGVINRFPGSELLWLVLLTFSLISLVIEIYMLFKNLNFKNIAMSVLNIAFFGLLCFFYFYGKLLIVN
ncbi:hypothetical protein [Aquimarina aggregata]|uniref:hypothetical protein n=1 Tax=Aquimarina aggregata TaxID=1642818 RepID=UPI002491C378|nr:hypothetical protein [Aquimarina aggregata]